MKLENKIIQVIMLAIGSINFGVLFLVVMNHRESNGGQPSVVPQIEIIASLSSAMRMPLVCISMSGNL